MAVVQVEGLLRTFGRVRALDGLTLSVEPGTVFGFLGPNGAGKTTTIRILTGLAHATGGRAWVTGIKVGKDHREIARRIGYLPEDPSYYPWLTPREFLDYVGRIFSLTAVERAERTRELLALVGLTEAANRRIGGFSRGMRQRLGLAQALVNRPQLLFLDEPASALDPAGRKEVLELIDRLRGTCTVFMSSHILADVERVCDTVGIIANGRLVVQDQREELLARFAAPVFELECDPSTQQGLADWVDGLRRLAWVTHADVTGLSVRLVVSDVQEAKRQLLARAVESRLILTRYEMVKPGLEEVFLRLVGQGETVQ